MMKSSEEFINTGPEKRKNKIEEQNLKKIIEFVETIQYGSVTIIIQDSKILQIEKNEKIRLK